MILPTLDRMYSIVCNSIREQQLDFNQKIIEVDRVKVAKYILRELQRIFDEPKNGETNG